MKSMLIKGERGRRNQHYLRITTLLKNQKSMLQSKLLTGFEQCSQCVQSYPVDLETRQIGYMAEQMSMTERGLKEAKNMWPVDVTSL